MLKELIEKLKRKKYQLQNYKTDNNDIKTGIKVHEEKEIEIIVSSQNNITKIEIPDYVCIGDFVDKKNDGEEYKILDLLCNCVLWNSDKQKVNKGIYYVIIIDNRIYNILFTDDKIQIDERISQIFDEVTNKENITQERVITYLPNQNKYRYYSAKHESDGNTYYTKYYNKNREYSLGTLDLTEEETFNEVTSVISNLETIPSIETILDIELLKEQILNDLKKDYLIKTRKPNKK